MPPDDLNHFGVTPAQLGHAAQLLRAGKLVAFPTETVYGLGANALDASAVECIYQAKGRPHSSPIIVHVSDYEMVMQVATVWPEAARLLTEKFWPGPLTLVLPKTDKVPKLVTAGLTTVGVRMPAHPVALALIQAARIPIAAPSANRFTEVSPTTAEHVRRSLGDRVDYILDGGPCPVGIESTVLSLAEPTPVLYRPGGISRAQIEEVIGPISRARETPHAAHVSPGLHPRHYSPRTRVLLVEQGDVPPQGSGAYLQHKHPPARAVAEIVKMPANPAEYASQLYGALHALDDAQSFDWIAVDLPPASPEWEAVLDRLRRAASSGQQAIS